MVVVTIGVWILAVTVLVMAASDPGIDRVPGGQGWIGLSALLIPMAWWRPAPGSPWRSLSRCSLSVESIVTLIGQHVGVKRTDHVVRLCSAAAS